MTQPREPWTAGDLVRWLEENVHPDQKLVFSDVRFGDFNLVGATGSNLSEDNFEKDIRPILRLEKRVD